MILHLTKIQLNPMNGRSLTLATDPYEIHRRLYKALRSNEEAAPDNSTDSSGILFRVDESKGGPIILVQTCFPPDWSRLPIETKMLVGQPQTKQLSPDLSSGQRLSFRLLCYPSVCRPRVGEGESEAKRPRGKRMACRDDDEKFNWLRRKSHDNGFRIESAGITNLQWYSSKNNGNHESSRKTSLGGARFDGIIIVEDPIRVTMALANGIGTRKAFGFGLLSLARSD